MRMTERAQQTAGRQRFTGVSQSVLIITARDGVARDLSRCMSGYRVSTATNITRALEEGFDLVIAHIESVDTAVLDGLEVLRAYDPDLPLVLFADAVAPASLASAAAALGVLDVLVELPTKESLQRLLKQGTNERSAAALRDLDDVQSVREVSMHPVVDPRTQRVTAYMARGPHVLACHAFSVRTVALFVEIDAEELFDASLPHDPAVATNVVLQVRLDDAALRRPDLPGRITALRRAGYRLALVECPIRHYVDLPPIAPDFVVLDARLTRRIDTSRGRREIVHALVAKAHALHALVIAVGVATSEERAVLLEARCDLIEGPLVARRR